jgi:hypothetical protein
VAAVGVLGVRAGTRGGIAPAQRGLVADTEAWRFHSCVTERGQAGRGAGR